MSQNLVLIGFMGVGKGTIARILAKKTGMFAVDSDDLIESILNRKVKNIFKENGEKYFRDMERETAKWLALHVKNTIISTGGGFFKVDNLNNIGKVIYLQSSFQGIIKRLKSQPNSKQKFEKRPLLKDLEKAKILFDQRELQYREKANILIGVEDKNIETIIEDILKAIA